MNIENQITRALALVWGYVKIDTIANVMAVLGYRRDDSSPFARQRLEGSGR